MPAVTKIDVHIKTPIINCTPKGGNVHANIMTTRCDG